MLRREPPVRSGRHGDLVASLVVDHDERRARGGLARRPDAVHADSLGRERGADLAAGAVVSHAGDETDVGTEPPSGHRLIGAFAPVVDEQRAAGDRLAGSGQAGNGDREVDVRRADYEDAR